MNAINLVDPASGGNSTAAVPYVVDSFPEDVLGGRVCVDLQVIISIGRGSCCYASFAICCVDQDAEVGAMRRGGLCGEARSVVARAEHDGAKQLAGERHTTPTLQASPLHKH